MRNDGAEGHGLVGGYDRAVEIDCLRKMVIHLSKILPIAGSNGELVIGPAGMQVQLRFLRLFDGAPVLLREIKRASLNRLRVDVQFIDRDGQRQSSRFEADNFFQALNAAALPKYESWPNSWQPLCYLPDRTTDSFQGRLEEQKALAEWMDDEDSRTCLVYGDGGVGKTTLVVEFLHRLLEEDPDLGVDWQPKAISFYTAKKWRWGVDGVELIASGQPHLIGLIAHLHLLLLGRLPSQEFYRLDVSQAAIRLQQLMSDEAILRRSDHLVVIDNSETLIASDQDIERLGRELREISRRIGRVVITSRRREFLEATPVAVDKLGPADALALLKTRASSLGVKAVRQAGDAQLLVVVNELGLRPLVIEAFLQALTDPASRTIPLAKARVSAMLRRDLGEFLFADAWARFSPRLKRLLLLMAKVADVHDGRQLAICCEISGVTLQEAEEAFEESSGIASVVRLNGQFEIGFSANFLEFSRDKSVLIGEKRHPLQSEVDQARSQYGRFVAAVRSFTGDRIALAFRTPLAKAAHKARRDNDQNEALKLYQQAILSDSSNGWLFDRFAYFLFHDVRDNEAALVQARRATELLPAEGEVWFTRGIIESRLGLYRQCGSSLEKAESYGVSPARCATQLAWAYLKAKPALLNLARVEIEKLRHMLASHPRSDRCWAELEMLMSRLAYLESRGRNVRG